VLELGAEKGKVADVPVSPVCGLDPDDTVTVVLSDEHVVLSPL
jgi:hypothetical protein